MIHPGKIAHLPREIREELNRRLADAESGGSRLPAGPVNPGQPRSTQVNPEKFNIPVYPCHTSCLSKDSVKLRASGR
jgi:hypothetical protein